MTRTLARAAWLALALGWPIADAQTPAKPPAKAPTKTLGTGRAGGKMLTRDELRACLTTQDSLKERSSGFERERAELDRDKAALQEAGSALKEQRATLERTRAETIDAYNAKVAAHGAKVEQFNRRMAALKEMQGQRDKRAEAEREQAAVEAERNELMQAEQAIKREADTINNEVVGAATAFNAKSGEHDRKIEDWNQRNRALAERAQGWEQEQQKWTADCMNRPYFEDDEIAIRRGK